MNANRNKYLTLDSGRVLPIGTICYFLDQSFTGSQNEGVFRF